MTQQWFVIETKMRREREASEEVSALGFECFMPVEVRKRQDRSQKARPIIEYEVAMFPRYIFPRFDIAQPYGWQRLGRLQSVKGWLKSRTSDFPSPIRNDFIDRVRQEQIAVRAALNNDHAIKLDPIPNGTRVIITDGPFATLGGIVNLSVGDRVKIMLDATNLRPLDVGRQSVCVA